jgi:hypothetical protein
VRIVLEGVAVEALNQGLAWIVGFEDTRSDRTRKQTSQHGRTVSQSSVIAT